MTISQGLVLVTGGAGFIGSHLVPALLASGRRVRVLDCLAPQIHGVVPGALGWLQAPGIEFMRASVTDRATWVKALSDVDSVVHLAAETGTGQSMYEVAAYNEVNSQGTALMLDVLANQTARTVKQVLLASSRSVYGEGAYACDACAGPGGRRFYPRSRSAEQLAAQRWEPACPDCGRDLISVPTHEDDAVRPASIYAATKFAQEDLLRVAAESLGIAHTILRLQNVYGQGQSLKNPYTGILSIFSTRIRRGLPLPVFEDGKESRDFVHVSDVVRAMAAALAPASPLRGVVNVGSGVATSVFEVAGLLSQVLGAPNRVEITGQYRLGDIRHNFADTRRLEACGAAPLVTLAEGLRLFADWVLTQPLPEDQLERANAELRARKLMS